MHFENKVIWITGASSGIGAELAIQLASHKARIILTARSVEALNSVREKCLKYNVDCAVLAGDMVQAAELPVITQEAMAIYGQIDMIIFSAGKSQRSAADETDMKVYRYLMELNFFAPVQLTKLMLPHFKKNGSGHLVAISSMAGLMGFPLRSGYAATKHALKGFFETLQTEHKIAGLEITIVSPGRIHTPISVNALTGDGSLHGSMDAGQLNGIPVADCAEKIIKAIAQKRKHLIIAKEEKLLWWIWWLFRPMYYRIARKKGLNK